MDLTEAFDTFQAAVNTEDDQVAEARRRRDLFTQAFGGEGDVEKTIPSGSLARGTILDPIHDVDHIALYYPDEHPDWGQPGLSAEEALNHVAGRVHDLLGAAEGSIAKEVRLSSPRNHAVMCFLDDPDEKLPFTVDLTPALRSADGHLLIPEVESSKWIETDPEDLIRRIRERHARWNRFVPLIRVLKHWNRDVANAGLISLAMEVLVYNWIPDEFSNDGGKEHRPEALSRFFTSAVVAIENPILDPAGLCGEIQPELDVERARAALQDSSDGAYLALAAERDDDIDAAICQWRKVLGELFPEPPGGCEAKRIGAGAAATYVAPRLIRDTPQGG